MKKDSRPLLTPSQKQIAIIFRLLASPEGIAVSALMRDYELSYRTFRNYLTHFQNIPDLADDLGDPLVMEDIREGVKYLRLKLSMIDGSKTSEQRALAFLSGILLEFLEGTTFYESLQQLGHIHSSDGMRILGVKYLDRKIYSKLLHPKIYAGKSEILKKSISVVLNQRKIDVKYKSRTSKSLEMIKQFKPYTVLHYRSGLYLVGECTRQEMGKIIYLAIERIDELKVLKESFHYPGNYSPQKLVSDSFGIMKGGKSFHVELLFKKNVAEQIKERLWHKTQKIVQLKNKEIKLTFTVSSLDEVINWVLSYGDNVKVLQPVELKNLALKRAQEFLFHNS